MNIEKKNLQVITVTAEPGDTLYDFWEKLGNVPGGGWAVSGQITIRETSE